MRVSVYAVAVAALAGCTVTQNPGQDVDSGGLEGEAGGSIDAAGSDGAAGPDGLAGEDASAGMNDSPSGTGADGTAASDLDGSDAALAEGAPGEAGGGADAGMASDAEQADATTTETTIGPFCGCPSGTTFDGRSCNPSDGCGAQTTPCSLPNATATCQAGACAVFQCAADYGDCNAQAADGCETSLRTSNADCGACGQACTGGATCIDGVCSVGCAPPLTSCSGTCADLVTSTAHCGGCSTGCASAYDQTATCVNGMCVYSAMTCPPGQTSCNGDCVDTTRDPSNCGGCYTSCYANGLVGVCTNGQCSPCPSGLVTCPNPAGLPFPCVDTQRSIANCGACGAGCSANQTCSMGTCVPLTSAALVTGIAVDDMAVDDTSIYFVSSGAGTVSVLPKTGGTAPRTLATGEAKPVHIALDAQYVYYSANLGGAIKRVPKNGATPAAVVVATTQPTELVVDSQRVYWVSGTTLSAAPSSGGGPATSLYDATGAFYGPENVRQNSQSLFFDTGGTSLGGRIIYQLAKTGGGTPTTIRSCDTAGLGGSVAALDADDDYVYSWCATTYAAPLLATSLGGDAGAPMILWAGVATGAVPTTLPHDGTDVVFGVNGLYELHYCSNTTPALLAGVPATLLASDASYVYWSEGTMIGRVAK